MKYLILIIPLLIGCDRRDDCYSNIDVSNMKLMHILIDESMPKEYVQDTIDALKDWELTVRRPLFTYGFTKGHMVARRDGLNVISYMYWTGDSKQGYANLYYNLNKVIIEGDIVINQYSVEHGVDFGTLMRHEIGHILGLKHIPGTIMNESLSYNTKREIDVSLPCEEGATHGTN